MARVTKAGIGLKNVGVGLRREVVGIQRSAIGEFLRAVSIDRAQKPPGEEIPRDFQSVEYRACVAVAEVNGLFHFEILARMAGLAFTGGIRKLLVLEVDSRRIPGGCLSAGGRPDKYRYYECVA